MKRETAWKIFAGEFNDSTYEIKGEGEMSPSYIVSPLGAKINRVFIIGVLTDVENVSESGELVRAHISDPTGVFTIYSGQYQQDVTDALSNIEVPSFVAIVGKVRTYTPEEGVFYVSVRPERIMEVNAQTRDKWILETCKNTKERIEAFFEAMKMNNPDIYSIKKLGYSKELSEGILEALKNYGKNVDLNRYIVLIQESLQYLVPGKEKAKEVKEEKTEKPKEIKKEEKIKENKTRKEETKNDDKDQEDEDESIENEKTVLEVIKTIEGEEGAAWDLITEKCEKKGLNSDTIEETLNSLMDKGLIYEPILGTIKTT